MQLGCGSEETENYVDCSLNPETDMDNFCYCQGDLCNGAEKMSGKWGGHILFLMAVTVVLEYFGGEFGLYF